ncbi:MAG: TatD family hydrolase [Bacteroidales bacterium]
MEIEDIHTHHLRHRAIVNSTPDDFDPQPGYYYSIGIHPWSSHCVTTEQLDKLDTLATHPSVIAIGETGIDKLRGASLEEQIELFRHHIHLAEKLGKPLIIHTVKSFNEILQLHRSEHPSVAWIIHGFRGNPTIAGQLIARGIYLSYGINHNPESLATTPRTHLLLETDTATELPSVATNTYNVSQLPPQLPFQVPYLKR